MARESKMKAVYLLPNGETQTRVDPDATGILWTLADGSIVSIDFTGLTDAVRSSAAWHGIKQLVGDSAAGKTDPNDVAEAMGGKIDLLNAGSFYAERAESGPRVSYLAAAIHAVKSDAGKLAPDETVAVIAAKLASDETYRKRAAANPQVAARVETMKAEAAAERAKAAKAKAKAEPATLDDL
jgi:hypothetical protein